MKRTLLALFAALSIIAVSLVTVPVSAQDPLNQACGGLGPGSQSTTCSGRSAIINPVIVVLVKVIEMLLVVIGVAAVIVIIIAGFRYITSSGDPNTVNSAKNTILFAVIGLVVAIVARVIVAFVVNRL